MPRLSGYPHPPGDTQKREASERRAWQQPRFTQLQEPQSSHHNMQRAPGAMD